MSARQRAWVAFCVTAVLVTNSICWARFERASLRISSLAALAWMLRYSKIPWDELLVVDAYGYKHLLRRLRLKVHEATRDGATILHSLTHVPRQVSAPQVAALSRKRWTLETAFKHLEAYFHAAINT